MSVRRVEDDARFHGGPGRGARLAVDDADARAVRRLVFNLFEGRRSMAFGGVRRCAADRKFVAQHPRGPHRQREIEDDDVVARERAVVEHDRAPSGEVDACVFFIRRGDGVGGGFSLIVVLASTAHAVDASLEPPQVLVVTSTPSRRPRNDV